MRWLKTLGSKWFYYVVTGIFIVIFALGILPFLVDKGIISVQLGLNLQSEAFGILFTLVVLVAMFELRAELRWRKVKGKVIDRISARTRELFIRMTHLIEFTWSTFPYEILNELHGKEKLTFTDDGKKLLQTEDFFRFLQNSRLILGEFEERYHRFLEADFALALMEIQKLLESLCNKIGRYKDPSTRKFVSEEFQEKELLQTIHGIIDEIFEIHEMGIDFWTHG